MAVYNGEKYLNEAIDSILNQTYTNIELIIVDDGSTDRTIEILNNYKDKDKDEKLYIIHLEQNKGAANALNVGINLANGSWIAIQDADDISLPNRIEEQVNYIRAHPDLVAVGSHIQCISSKEDISLVELQNFEWVRNMVTTREEINDRLFLSCPLTHGSVMFSKEAFNKTTGYNPIYKIGYDYDLWMQLWRVGPIENIPMVLYQYRLNPSSLSNKNLQDTVSESVSISTKYLNKYIFKANRRSRIYVFSTKRRYKFFKNNLHKNGKQNLYIRFPDINRKKYANFVLKKVRKRKADGVIVLIGPPYSSKIYSYLKKKGLRHNKNLLQIWVE